MKKILFIAAMLAAIACERIEPPISTITPAPEPEPEAPKIVYDTTVYACAVDVPPTYDWARDPSMGKEEATLLLFKNGKKALTLKTGAFSHISADPTTHHLLNGHIYTEFTFRGGTDVKCDGKTVFTSSRHESLKGLLLHGGKLISLSQDIDSGVLRLRQDGIVIEEIKSATLFGGISEPSPALYEDAGQWYFSYVKGAEIYRVAGGTTLRVQPPEGRITDYRIIGGKGRFFAGAGSFSLGSKGGHVLAWGQAEDSHDTIVQDLDSGRSFTLSGDFPLLYSGNLLYAVSLQNGLTVQSIDAEGHTSTALNLPDGFFFSTACASDATGSLYLAVTQKKKAPYLWKDGAKLWECPVNGYLSAVEAVLTERR